MNQQRPDTFDISPNPNLGDARPIIGVARTPVRQSHELHPNLRHTARPDGPRDFRGDAPIQHQPVGISPSKGNITNRQYRSAEEAVAQNLRVAMQAAPEPTIDAEAFHSLKIELQAERERSARLERQLEQVLARLDAMDGGEPPEAA
jgi:hypothetical protein